MFKMWKHIEKRFQKRKVQEEEGKRKKAKKDAVDDKEKEDDGEKGKKDDGDKWKKDDGDQQKKDGDKQKKDDGDKWKKDDGDDNGKKGERGKKGDGKRGKKGDGDKGKKVMRIKRIKTIRGRGRMMMILLVMNWKNKLGRRRIESRGDKKWNLYQRILSNMFKMKPCKTKKMMPTTMLSRKRLMTLMKKKGMAMMTRPQQVRKK